MTETMAADSQDRLQQIAALLSATTQLLDLHAAEATGISAYGSTVPRSLR